jgi:MoxR-like ATPase
MTAKMETKDLIQLLAGVDDALRSHTAQYFNSRVFFSIRDAKAKRPLQYDVNDMILLACLTNSDILLSGKTGCGKSHLSRMAMNGLFGEQGFTNLTVTPGLSESDFIDIDVGAVKRGEKTLKQAIEKTPILAAPGSIINEINRTPEILQNLFISYLERIFSLKGVEFPVGVPFVPKKDSPQDAHYQFRVISINEGADYAGTSGIDRAVRDRVTVEVPMDYFRPTKSDVRRIVSERNNSDLHIERVNGGKLEDVLAVVKGVESVPYSVSAREFLVYLEGLSNCVKSPTHSKNGINFSSKMCEGCHHAKSPASSKGNICGSVYAPSDRSLINLKKIGRIVAALRAYKVADAVAQGELKPEDPKKFVSDYVAGLKVTMDDLIAVAPFILASKMIIDPKWIGAQFSGSKFSATQHVVAVAAENFKKYISSQPYKMLMESDGQISPIVRDAIKHHVMTADPWVYNLGDLSDKGYEPGTRKKPVEELLR